METVKKSYHSCFIVDVQINDSMIRLLDSNRNPYYINVSDKESVQSFKRWFKQIFMKGISQTLSIFEYDVRKIDEGETGAFILKFLNVAEDEKKTLNE